MHERKKWTMLKWLCILLLLVGDSEGKRKRRRLKPGARKQTKRNAHVEVAASGNTHKISKEISCSIDRRLNLTHSEFIEYYRHKKPGQFFFLKASLLLSNNTAMGMLEDEIKAASIVIFSSDIPVKHHRIRTGSNCKSDPFKKWSISWLESCHCACDGIGCSRTYPWWKENFRHS